MAGIHKLTPKEIEHGAGPWLSDGGNLLMKVSGNSRVWFFRYKVDGKQIPMSLGSYPEVPAKEARAKAADYRKTLATGGKPKVEREAKKVEAAIALASEVTFDQVAARFIAMKAAERHKPAPGEKVGRLKWCANYVKAWEVSLRKHVSPVFGHLPVAKIDETLVHQVLDPLRNKNETFHQTQDRMQIILSFAIARKHRKGPNPAAWKDNLEHAAYDKRDLSGRRASLLFAELPGFMVELRKESGIGPLALELTILTGLRATEVLGAHPTEIDREAEGGPIWTIPAKRMKIKTNGDHVVPLSDAAIAVLDKMEGLQRNGFVFPGIGGKHLNRSTMLMLVKKLRPAITVHGFRRTFKQWANTAGYSDDVSERALAHVVGNQTNRRYAGDSEPFGEREELMNDWADYCNGKTPVPKSKPNLTLVRRAA